MAIQYPYSLKKTSIHPEIELTWVDEGSGPKTILFVHGLAGYLPLWKNQIDRLKSDYRCIAIDLPGNGLSSSAEYPYSMFFYAESIARFIEKEKLDPVMICGHSMGGQVSMLLALRYPALIEKMILIASAGFESFAQHEIFMMEQMMHMGNLFYVNMSHMEQTIRQSFFKENEQAAHIISDIRKIIKFQSARKWNAMISASILAMLKEPVLPHLHLLNMPVKIIFGEKDAFIPNNLIHPSETTRSLVMQAEAKIPKSDSAFISGAGHFVHLEKSMAVNDEINRFLQH